MTRGVQAGAHALGLVGILWAGSLVTAASPMADVYTHAASDHFEVYTTAGTARARDTLNYFENVHGFFVDFLKMSPPPRSRARLIVFNGEKQYAPFRPNDVATAFYQPGSDRDHIVMRSLDVASYPLIVHEYAHLMMRDAKLPLWMNEGLAEFFSTIAPERDRMTLGKVPLGRLQHLLFRARMLPMAQLIAITPDSPEYNTKDHAGTFYSQSWAITHMIMTDPRYAGGSSQVIQRLSVGQPSAAVLTSVYGKSVEAIDRDLQIYVRADRYRYFLADYRLPKAGFTQPTRVVPAFEADLVIANLMAAMPSHEDAARKAFAALEASMPDNLEVVEARATFEWRRGNLEIAERYLTRSIELGTRNSAMYLSSVRLMGMGDPVQVESLLNRALALNPDDLEVRVRLAEFLGRRRRYQEALTTLAPLTPSDVPAEHAFVVFQILVTANAAMGRAQEAMAAADRLMRIAQPGSEATRAAQMKADIMRDAAPPVPQLTAAVATAPSAATSPSTSAEPRSAEPPRTVSTPFSVTTGVTRFIDGDLRNMICGTRAPILEVRTTDGRSLRLVIDDPLAIKVEGTATTTDLRCGAQQRQLTVGYDPAVDAVTNTVGKVRLLRFVK